jgi:hypothetical protein
MPNLPTDAVPVAEFLVRRLYRSIDVGGGSRYFAIAETEHPGDDDWFWNDDNAKVLELMSRPEVWQRFPQETGEILRFVRSMCRGPFIFRRVSAPRLDLIGTEGSVTSYRHSLMQLKYDLAQGAVVAGVRFHDERSGDNLMLHGNYIEFTHRGRRFKERVRTGGKREAAREGHILSLYHAAPVEFGPAWRRRRLGEITYTYTFDATSMLFSVEAVLALDPEITVSDVVLTIGHDGLAHCYFNNIVTDRTPPGRPLFSAGKPKTQRLGASGSVYYAIRQGHISGDALAVHSVPRPPQRLAGIEAVVDIQGRLGRVLARYEFPGSHRGARLVAAEDKLITAGGFYDRIADYAAFMQEAAATRAAPHAAADFSISYDYGATLNAFAKCFAVAAGGTLTALPTGLPDELHGLFDTALKHYCELYLDRHEQQPNAIFSRELAFATLAVTTMYRATGADEYRRRLGRMCDVLLDFEQPFDDGSGATISAFLMRKDSPRAAYVDCHSGALLALTHASRYIADPRLAATIDRALAAYGVETARAGGVVDTVSTVMVDEHGTRRTENAFWNFKAGLTLRFFTALRGAADPALRAVAERHNERMQLFEMLLRRQLERSVVEHDDGIELNCSVASGGTNSESQPWTMLGLIGHPCD